MSIVRPDEEAPTPSERQVPKHGHAHEIEPPTGSRPDRFLWARRAPPRQATARAGAPPPPTGDPPTLRAAQLQGAPARGEDLLCPGDG